MQVFSSSPVEFAASSWRSRHLTYVLTRREVLGRYRGSMLGLFWSLFNPVLLLAVYTFVFSVVFKARWNGGTGSMTEFALIVFIGLTVYNIFAECILRAPNLILGNVGFVKRVVFPLEILPLVALGAAVFHATVSIAVWLVVFISLYGAPHFSIVYFPFVALPLLLMTLGIMWLLAAIGVYVRDTSQVVAALIPMLMFLTPIFYPMTALPEAYQRVFAYNPLAFVVEQSRIVLFYGNSPDWQQLSFVTAMSGVIAWLGFAWFQMTRRGFADVI